MAVPEQVTDLRPGDVVEIREAGYTDVVTRGPLHRSPSGSLDLGGIFQILNAQGESRLSNRYTIAVVSRAPTSLYVNHPRVEPVPGDVARDADSADVTRVWYWLNDYWWWLSGEIASTSDMPQQLRLLVDGETGQAVP